MRHLIFIWILITCMPLSIATSVQSASLQPKYNSIEEVPQATWNKLASKKIYFGHHSVGLNILQGLTTILQKHPNIRLKLQESKNVGQAINSPALVEGGVGRNFYPDTKFESFTDNIKAGYGDTADIAFFKLCFVDFNPATDIDALFASYKETLDSLSKQYPNTIFAVITTPLTCYAPGLRGVEKRAKDLIKKMIGKFNQYDHSSANAFNELLINHYADRVPIFDLAKFESTRSDGSRVSKTVKGQELYELVPEYTTDGGHLNQEGMAIISERFLLFLAELADE